MIFVGFLLSIKDDIFTLPHFFFQIASDSHGTLYLAVGLAAMHSTSGSMWAVTKFSYSSFGLCLRYLLKSAEFVSYIYCISIGNISIGECEDLL